MRQPPESCEVGPSCFRVRADVRVRVRVRVEVRIRVREG